MKTVSINRRNFSISESLRYAWRFASDNAAIVGGKKWSQQDIDDYTLDK